MRFERSEELARAHLSVAEFRAARMRLPERADPIFQFLVRFALISVLNRHTDVQAFAGTV